MVYFKREYKKEIYFFHIESYVYFKKVKRLLSSLQNLCFYVLKKKYAQGLRNDVIFQSYYSKNKDKMVLLLYKLSFQDIVLQKKRPILGAL
jgi:hypothetical protein